MSDPRDDARSNPNPDSGEASGEDRTWLWDVAPELCGAMPLPVSGDAEVGARLRARRRTLGMPQQALATAVGLSFQQVQKYEKGTNKIGAGRLSEIAHCLGVPPCYFFLDTHACPHHAAPDNAKAETADTAQTAEYAEYEDFLKRAQSLLATFRHLPPDQQTLALRLTQTLTNLRPPQNDGPG